MKNNKGFTLIELLVVVLIIGILAAIALPQYFKAVRKARASEALIVVKNLRDAADRFILAHGSLNPTNNPISATTLDIEMPTSDNYTYAIGPAGITATASGSNSNGVNLGFSANANQDGFTTNAPICVDTQAGAGICASLGNAVTTGTLPTI